MSNLLTFLRNPDSVDDAENGNHEMDVEKGHGVNEPVHGENASTEAPKGPIQALTNHIVSFHSMITGSRKRAITETTEEQFAFQPLEGISARSHSAPSKVRLVEQSTFQTRTMLEEKEKQIAMNEEQADRQAFQLDQAMRRVVELEELVKNGRGLLAEVKGSANRTKSEMRRRITELEDAVKTDQVLLAEAREHAAKMKEGAEQWIAELEGSLKNNRVLLAEVTDRAEQTTQKDQALLVEAREHAAKVKEGAEQRIAELEGSLKNNCVLLAEVTNRAEQTKQMDQALLVEAREHAAKVEEGAQQRIAELQESLKNNRILLLEITDRAEQTRQEAQRQIAELEESAMRDRRLLAEANERASNSTVPAIGLPSMPGGMPGQTNAMDMDMDIDLDLTGLTNEVPLVEVPDFMQSDSLERRGDITKSGAQPLADALIDLGSDISSDSDEFDDNLQPVRPFPIPAPTQMRAPKGGAGPRLLITNPQPTDPHPSSVSSQRRAPSQAAAMDSQARTGSSRLTYPRQPSIPTQKTSRRSSPLGSLGALDSPPQVTYPQSLLITNPHTTDSRPSSVSSQRRAPSQAGAMDSRARMGSSQLTYPRQPSIASTQITSRRSSPLGSPGALDSPPQVTYPQSLLITNPHTTDLRPSSVSSVRPRIPSQAATVDSQARMGSSRLTYPRQPLVASIHKTPSPLASLSPLDSPSQVTYPQIHPKRRSYNSPLVDIATESVASQTRSPTLSRYSPSRTVSPAELMEGSPGLNSHGLPRIVSPTGLSASQRGSPILSPRIPENNRAWGRSSDWSVSSSGGSSARLMSLEGKFDALSSDVREMKDILLRNGSDSRNDCRAQSSRDRLLPPLRFKDPPERVRNAETTELQKIVRSAMNVCIGIKQDKAICEIQDLPTEDVVDDYDDDPGNATMKPTLDPMRPAFVSIRSEWNEKLWELLEIEMLQDTGYSSIMMKKAFFNRLMRLGRIIRESHQRANETQEQFQDRQTGHTAEKQRRRQRAHTRRATLFNSRKTITEWNRLDRDGNADEAWSVLDYVVATLSPAGMSSDESDKDTPDKTVYVIKPTPWRDPYVTELLRHVDKDLNKTNGFGSRRRGNAPRTREWRPGTQSSARQAPPCLPTNFYDHHWYNDLSDRDKRELQAGDIVHLPRIDQARYSR